MATRPILSQYNSVTAPTPPPLPPAPAPTPSPAKGNGHAAALEEVDATREMPRVAAPKPDVKRPAPPPPKPVPPAKAPAKPAKKAAASPAPSGKGTAASPALEKKVMADAVRLLKWGKEWHELVDLIARIADRPPAAEIRRILRTHKAEIELQAEGDE